ncbi:hypothetical protein Glove_309g24 [Diversispora epigaea]|uniref:BTB domain-containing protein n=1 Tax=Diversispora epigaea TaxID=1348612 RepID=A0A397HVM0_9GLOM|nr:hypothetical protein Glove_309g24 [Diversispora epigaea]
MSLQMFKMFKYLPFVATSIRNTNKNAYFTSVLSNSQKRKISLKFFDKLSQNFTELLLNDKDNHNVIIEAKDMKTYTAHSSVLKYRSPYFRKELENIIPDEKNIKTIINPNISDEIFDIILKYIYGGTVNLEKVETRFIFDLMKAANIFELEELSKKLETILIEDNDSCVLKYRSPYFRKELENIIPDEKNIKTIINPNISDEIFDIILKYIYGGTVNLEKVETRFIFDLMKAANIFELEELSKKLETILIEDNDSWLKTHFSLVYQTIFDKQSFKDLANFCNDIVVKHPNLIFDSDFTSLPESAFVSLLKRDDLTMKEVEIWNYGIKWGIAQNPSLPTNLEKWTKENFLTPYKEILDKQLWEDIEQHVFVPDRPVKSIILPARSKGLFSTIISEDHVAEISSWIDRETTTYPTKDIPYKFELILSGTRDGLTPQTFWNTCHNHARTVIVAKVKGTDEIIGGYNPLTWDNTYSDDQWMETDDSFIFSLKNGSIQDSIISRVENTQRAILNVCKNDQNNHGPYFGYDFYLSGDESNFNLDYRSKCIDGSRYYEKPIRTSSDKLSIDDYEVFKVVKQ